MKKADKTQMQVVKGVRYQYKTGQVDKKGPVVAMILEAKGAKGKLAIPRELGGRQVWGIDDYAFADSKALKSVTVPDGVQVVGLGAFDSCVRLASVELPKGLRQIQPYAFSNCRALKSVVIPEGTELLAAPAFENCTALESVQLPRGVSIGYPAYFRKNGQKLMKMPKEVRENLDKPFDGCTGLKTVTVVGRVTAAIRKSLRGMKVQIRSLDRPPSR